MDDFLKQEGSYPIKEENEISREDSSSRDDTDNMRYYETTHSNYLKTPQIKSSLFSKLSPVMRCNSPERISSRSAVSTRYHNLKSELDKGIQNIRTQVKERRLICRQQLRAAFKRSKHSEQSIHNLSEKHSHKWLKIQGMSTFLCMLRQSLRDARNFGLKSSRMIELEKNHQREEKRKPCLLYPEDDFHSFHALVLLIVTIYLVITIPLNIAFDFKDHSKILYILDLGATLYFCFDILVNFFSAFPRDMVIIDCRKEIALNYLKKWFLLDLLVVIPFGSIFKTENFWLGEVLILLRLARILNSSLQNTVSKKKSRGLVEDRLKRIFADTEVAYIMKTFLVTCFFIHITSCMWVWMGSFSEPNWILRVSKVNDFSPINNPRKYLLSMYYVLTTVATIGFGDIVPISIEERIFSCFLIVFGVWSYTNMVSMVLRVATNPA